MNKLAYSKSYCITWFWFLVSSSATRKLNISSPCFLTFFVNTVYQSHTILLLNTKIFCQKAHSNIYDIKISTCALSFGLWIPQKLQYKVRRCINSNPGTCWLCVHENAVVYMLQLLQPLECLGHTWNVHFGPHPLFQWPNVQGGA